MPKKSKDPITPVVAKRNAPFELAEAFIQKRYGRPFRAYDAFHKQTIHNARAVLGGFVDPLSGTIPPKYDVDDFINALDIVMRAHGNQRFNTLLDFMGSDPRTGLPYLEGLVIAPPAPLAGTAAYDAWVQKWGKKAIDQGLWDGIYFGWDGVRYTPEGPFTFNDLVACVGESLARASLNLYTKYIEARHAGMESKAIVPLSASEQTLADIMNW